MKRPVQSELSNSNNPSAHVRRIGGFLHNASSREELLYLLLTNLKTQTKFLFSSAFLFIYNEDKDFFQAAAVLILPEIKSKTDVPEYSTIKQSLKKKNSEKLLKRLLQLHAHRIQG